MTKKQMRAMGINPDDFEMILDETDVVYDDYELVTIDDDEED